MPLSWNENKNLR